MIKSCPNFNRILWHVQDDAVESGAIEYEETYAELIRVATECVELLLKNPGYPCGGQPTIDTLLDCVRDDLCGDFGSRNGGAV